MLFQAHTEIIPTNLKVKPNTMQFSSKFKEFRNQIKSTSTRFVFITYIDAISHLLVGF